MPEILKSNTAPEEQARQGATALDGDRTATWLFSPYSASVWQVADTENTSRTAQISFEYPLPDGSLLTHSTQLYATVKEYVWWLRDGRFARVDTAYFHAILSRHMMHLAHALSLRGISSFKFLTPYDIEQLVEECRFGTDAVIHASERVQKYIENLKTAGLTPPQYVDAEGYPTTRLWGEKIYSDCCLPIASVKRLPRVAWLLASLAKATGFSAPAEIAAEIPPFRTQTSVTLGRWLDPLEGLWVMRRYLKADAISFKPFPQGAAKVAVIKGIETAPTPIPPPQLALYLFNQAVKRVLGGCEVHSSNAPTFTDEPTEIIEVATACWIVIAAFTARRDREIDELTDDSLAGNDADGWWLNMYIEKTLLRKDWIPVPNVVARAVQLLLKFSHTARQLSGSKRIFQTLTKDGTAVTLDLGRRLDRFAASVGVPLHTPRGGPPHSWHWTPHQVRRFFAICYFYQYEGATIETLAHQLRHFNLEMTRRYVTRDKEVASLWRDVAWGYRSDFARSIVAGERAVTGPMGEHLKKSAQRIIEQFRRKVQVVSPERAGASLGLLMERQRLVLTPRPWVTCSCPHTIDGARQAHCRSNAVDLSKQKGPDFANADTITCHQCPFAIIQSSQITYAASERETLRKKADNQGSPNPTFFQELERLRLAQLTTAIEEISNTATPLPAAFRAKDDP